MTSDLQGDSSHFNTFQDSCLRHGFLTPAEAFTRPDQWIPFADCFSNPESSGHMNAHFFTLCPSELADRRLG